MTKSEFKYWAASNGNGGYDIGEGDLTIASVIACRDMPRVPYAKAHDPRAVAMLMRAAPDLVFAAQRALQLCIFMDRGAVDKAAREESERLLRAALERVGESTVAAIVDARFSESMGHKSPFEGV